MERIQPRVISQRPQLLGLQPSAAFTGHNLLGQFQSSAYCWECMFEQSLYSLFQQQAGIEKASFSRLAAFDLSNLELTFWSQIELFKQSISVISSKCFDFFFSPPFLFPTPHSTPPQNVRISLWPALKIIASLSFHVPGPLFLQPVSSSGCACVQVRGVGQSA